MYREFFEKGDFYDTMLPCEDVSKHIKKNPACNSKCTLLEILRDALYPIKPYSKRLKCISFLKKTAYDFVKDPDILKEWEEVCAILNRTTNRVRELVAEGKTVTKKWDGVNEAMDEFSFLMENITPEEMTSFIHLAPSHLAHAKLTGSGENALYDMYSIFGAKENDDIGTLPARSFCFRLFTINYIRNVYTYSTPMPYDKVTAPLPPDLRNQCFEIYIQQRIKLVREELMEKDETRPSIPSDLECLQLMFKRDGFKMEKLDKMMNSPKVPARFENKYNVSKEFFDSAVHLVVSNVYNVVSLFKCYYRYLEEKINKIQNQENMPQNITYKIENSGSGDVVIGPKNVYQNAPSEIGTPQEATAEAAQPETPAEPTQQPQAEQPQELPIEQPNGEPTDGTIDQHRRLFKDAMLKAQDYKPKGSYRYLMSNTYDWVAAERLAKDLGIIQNYEQLADILQDKRFRKVPKNSQNLTKYRAYIDADTRYPNWQCSVADVEGYFRKFKEIANIINSIYQLGCKKENIKPYGSQ